MRRYVATGIAMFSAGLSIGVAICRHAVAVTRLRANGYQEALRVTTDDRDRLKAQLRQIRILQARSRERHLRMVQQ